MKRTPLPPRTARIKIRRVTRGGRGSDPAKLAWLRELRCVAYATDAYFCWGGMTVHHDRPRGARATDARTCPVCVGHHTAGRHSVTALGRRRWQEVVLVDLELECARYEAAWQSRKASEAMLKAAGIA